MEKLILLIDDNSLDNFISRTVIKYAGYGESVIEFQSSTEAVGYLNDMACNVSPVPDFIFLDIKMPMLDGFDVLNEFSKLPGDIKNKIKVIMLSSSINDEDIEKANSNPLVFKFISKPLTMEKIHAINGLKAA